MRSSLLLAALLSILLAPARPAHAYPDEAEGWGGVRWGDSAKTLMKRRSGIKKKGYRLGNVLASLRRSEGGIFLDESTTTYGQDEAGIRWYIRKGEGVFKVEISLEDSNPMTELSGKSIRGVIEAAHGPGGRDRERRAVWPGKVTVIEVEAPTMLTGAHVIVTHTRRSEWEGKEAELDLPDGWGAAEQGEAEAEPEPAPAPAKSQADPAPSAASPAKRKPAGGAAQPSAMERAQREAAQRIEASKEAAKEHKAAKKKAQQNRGLPEIEEAEGLLDPSVE